MNDIENNIQKYDIKKGSLFFQNFSFHGNLIWSNKYVKIAKSDRHRDSWTELFYKNEMNKMCLLER